MSITPVRSRSSGAELCQPEPMSTNAPVGDLATFDAGEFSADGVTHAVYRKGTGPAVVVITEMPNLSPSVLGFADRLVALGCSAVLPDLYGIAGREPLAGRVVVDGFFAARSMIGGCISRDFSTFALGRTSPVVDWLRALARAEQERCGGPGVGVVGMCFSGGFALATATDPSVVAPVMSQPSLPLPIGSRRRAAIDISDADLAAIEQRCTAGDLSVMGLRFDGDPMVPPERFARLKKRLGDRFIAIELDQADGNPAGLESPLITGHHSVLTTALNDEPGEPTRRALDDVLEFMTSRLL